jgi:hypothetical protein
MKEPNAREQYRKAKEDLIDAGAKLALKAVDEALKPYEPLRDVPLRDIRAVQKMKHGHQAPWYRKSVRSDKKPEEDD